MNKDKPIIEWKSTWVVASFEGRNKVEEKKFKTEIDMAYYLYLKERDGELTTK